MTERVCSNCAFSHQSTRSGLLCNWERKVLPPPVARKYTQMKKPPETRDEVAAHCRQYEEKK